MFQAGMHTDDGPEYWSVLDAQHDRYRRALRVLVATAIVLLTLAVIVHPAVAGLALALSPIIGIHIVLLRHSRSRVSIPDHRAGSAADPATPTAGDRR